MTNKPYNQIDHSHCWTKQNPPCGQRIEHAVCCLCEMVNPKYDITAEREALREEASDKLKKFYKWWGNKYRYGFGVTIKTDREVDAWYSGFRNAVGLILAISFILIIVVVA